MKIRVLAFAQARERLGFAERMVDCSEEDTPRAILLTVAPDYCPDPSIRVAVNRAYADWDKPVGAAFELAVIPMVSGG